MRRETAIRIGPEKGSKAMVLLLDHRKLPLKVNKKKGPKRSRGAQHVRHVQPFTRMFGDVDAKLMHTNAQAQYLPAQL